MNMDIRELHRDLVSLHERPDPAHTTDGVRQLLGTILSQSVADAQTARATHALFERYPDYQAMETAPHEELADVIEVAGLKNQKAARIQRALTAIREETDGEYTLGFLADQPTDAAQSWLTNIKGIGPKTASVVLNFHFEKPTFAVDTHVERLAKRFGLLDSTASNKRAHTELNEQVPDDLKYSLHVLMITHGREYCTAQNPDCANPVCKIYCSCSACGSSDGS
nr:endonuclease III [Haloquadratum walsbyi]